MQKYDTYTPEINYGDEEAAVTVKSEQNVRTTRKPVRRRRQTTVTEQPSVTLERKPSRPSLWTRIRDFFASSQFKILSGIFFGCLTIYLVVTFFSYFSTCIEDASKISSGAVGSVSSVANPGGEGGARLSELLINQGFGLGSFVIIIWLGAITLKLLVGRPKFRLLDFTIKCMVALITVSLIIGLVTYNLHTQVNWGGYHGTFVNEFIISFIGNIGAVLLSIFMIALFVVICLHDLVKWIIKTRRIRAERRRKAKEERLAREAREAEIRRMQEQERIEDLHAGESALISGGDITDDSSLDADVDFSDTSSIYEIQDSNPMEQGSDNESEKFDTERSEGSVKIDDPEGSAAVPDHLADDAGERASRLSSPDTDNENTSDSIISDSSGDVIDESGTGSQANKMVVNVNSIGQTSAKRFIPDVEAFENQKYKFPPYELLREGKTQVTLDANEQMENQQKIEKTLLDFGIPITRIEATIGPTVTLYEIVPENGVKIARIRSLVDDIALSLSATGVRIIAPIPGKGTVGIEVANKDPQTVSMRTVIKSPKYQETKYNLPIALGSTISNDVYIADLTKMPHLLVAGATGQGKSVGLNAIIASLLYCKAPHEVKFVMIDPKQVEFSLYNKLKNYYMAAIPGDDEEAVITDMDKVEATLNSLCIEMENRYTLLKTAHSRNVEEYNAKIREGKLNPAEGHRFLPYIVVIVDEFGDLIMVKGKGVEMPIARLAQKARAVGMHVIIATQRPSTNVITGIIKANFPARMSFKVTSGVDSKTILDTSGAQQLIGRGDMLIFNNSEMVRVQCAFIDTPEVEAICDYVERQPYPQGIYELPEPVMEGGEAMVEKGTLRERDPKLFEVARAVVSSGKASTSAVQRSFELGYNRAGRIMDQLERLGVVGPAQGGKPRALLVDPMGLEEILSSLE